MAKIARRGIPGKLTTGEVALRLGISQQSVLWYVKKGKLKAKRNPFGWFLVDEADVERLAGERAAKETAAA